MITCINCGAEFLSEIKFCPECGAANNLDFPAMDQNLGQAYMVKRNILERMFLVLFDKRVQADICANSYTGETIFVFLLVLVISALPDILNYMVWLSYPYPSQAVTKLANFYFSLILYNLVISSISPFLFALFALIGNYIANTRNTYFQTLQLIIFMTFPISIIDIVLNYFYSLQIYRIGLSLNQGSLLTSFIFLLIEILVFIVIMSFGFRTLFDCSYIKALFITLISGLTFNFILLILKAIFVPGAPPENL